MSSTDASLKVIESLDVQLAVLLPLAAIILAGLRRLGVLSLRPLRDAPPRATGLTGVDLLLLVALVLGSQLFVAALLSRLGLIGAGLSPRQVAVQTLVAQSLVYLLPFAFVLIRLTQAQLAAEPRRWRSLAAAARGGLTRLGLVPRRFGRDALWGVLAVIAAFPVIMAVSTVMVAVHLLLFETPPPLLGHDLLVVMRDSVGDPPTLATLVLSAVVIAPLTEELLFRGVVQSGLLSVFAGRHAATLLSAALIFTLMHAAVPWHVLPGLFVLGIVLGWLYERTGSLWPSIIAHAVFNAVNTGIVVMG